MIAAAIAFSTVGASAAPPERFIPMLGTGDAVPPIPMITQDSRPFTLADFRGSAVLVSFIYTRCRDPRMCPLVSAKFARIAQAIGGARIRLVLITLDPGYDTPAVLRRYGRSFGADPRSWTLATASAARLAELATRLGIATATIAPGTIAHTEAAIVIGPDGRIAQTIFGNAWSPADLIGAAQSTLADRQDPLTNLRTWLGAAIERCGGGSLALSGAGLVAVFSLVLLAVTGAFWLAFREKPAPRRSTKT